LRTCATNLCHEPVPGLPSDIRQEDESRRLFQMAFGAIDTDESKTISWREFAAFYCGDGGGGGGSVENAEQLQALMQKQRELKVLKDQLQTLKQHESQV
jgi:hypothetical protein